MEPVLPCVIVGAGQAGLATSRHLQRRGVDHIVLERGRVGESWRSQRWDSFRVNTPNWMNGLPDRRFDGEPDAFPTAAELVGHFEQYVSGFHLPVTTGVTVTSVERHGGRFAVHTDHPQMGTLVADTVVVASGAMHSPKIPEAASAFPGRIVQVHAADYRNPDSLPPGAVLVVGSGQSGCQIAEDLLSAGRPVFLCVSRVGRVPRRYRGRETLEWWRDMGLFATTLADLPDPMLRFAPPPQVSGVGRYGHTTSLQHLAGGGVVLLGRLRDVNGDRVTFDDSVAAGIRFGDTVSAEFKQAVDDHLSAAGLTPPPLEADPADEVCTDPASLAGPSELDLADEGITSVVWTTGFTADFSWIPSSARDDRGIPIHEGGVSPVPGLLFVGFPWLRTRTSGIIAGVDDDGSAIARAVLERLSA